jgi:general secretion pathway protein A
LLPLLRSPELRQLDQRVSIRYQIKPLSEDEMGGYISHRLAIANGASNLVFTPTALRVVYDYTAGIPRLINMLCDRALLAGYTAHATRIDEDLTTKAAEGLDLKPLVRSQRSIFNRLLGRQRS